MGISSTHLDSSTAFQQVAEVFFGWKTARDRARHVTIELMGAINLAGYRTEYS